MFDASEGGWAFAKDARRGEVVKRWLGEGQTLSVGERLDGTSLLDAC
jgi:hypothetical protein